MQQRRVTSSGVGDQVQPSGQVLPVTQVGEAIQVSFAGSWVGTAGQFGRGLGEVLGQCLCGGVGVAGQRRLLQPAVLANAVPVGVAVRRPAASGERRRRVPVNEGRG